MRRWEPQLVGLAACLIALAAGPSAARAIDPPPTTVSTPTITTPPLPTTTTVPLPVPPPPLPVTTSSSPPPAPPPPPPPPPPPAAPPPPPPAGTGSSGASPPTTAPTTTQEGASAAAATTTTARQARGTVAPRSLHAASSAPRANASAGSPFSPTWVVRRRPGRAGAATLVFRLPGLEGAPIAASRRMAASTRVSSLSPAPAELSLVPHSGVLAAGFSKTGGGFGARDSLLLADVLFAIALLALAVLPARTLAHVRLAAVVEA